MFTFNKWNRLAIIAKTTIQMDLTTAAHSVICPDNTFISVSKCQNSCEKTELLWKQTHHLIIIYLEEKSDFFKQINYDTYLIANLIKIFNEVNGIYLFLLSKKPWLS